MVMINIRDLILRWQTILFWRVWYKIMLKTNLKYTDIISWNVCINNKTFRDKLWIPYLLHIKITLQVLKINLKPRNKFQSLFQGVFKSSFVFTTDWILFTVFCQPNYQWCFKRHVLIHTRCHCSNFIIIIRTCYSFPTNINVSILLIKQFNGLLASAIFTNVLSL